MPRPKRGSICEVQNIYGQDGDAATKMVFCTNVGKVFFNSVDDPDSRIMQYPVSTVVRILEGEEAMVAYRKWKQQKQKE